MSKIEIGTFCVNGVITKKPIIAFCKKGENPHKILKKLKIKYRVSGHQIADQKKDEACWIVYDKITKSMIYEVCFPKERQRVK